MSQDTCVTPHQAKFHAYDLTKRAPAGAADQLSMSLFDASVDLNPHQIEAAMFALQSPLTEGVILADEVGLGKTIEAGIVLCQKWAERRRRLLIVCPASLRKQWASELEEKFNLPAVVLDAKAYGQMKRSGRSRPFDQKAVVIVSYEYAARMQDDIRIEPWDLVVIDEAHKLRNAWRPNARVGQALRWALEGRRKILLTATPLQNSLMELYGLSTMIDEHMFGDPNAFRSRYVNAGGDLDDLRQRLSTFCKRTLRRQVLEYVRYTRRKALTQPFHPSDAEQSLYDGVSSFLQRENTYAVPPGQRHLLVLLMRKLLASSSSAIAGTLDGLKARLEVVRDGRAEVAPVPALEDLAAADDIDQAMLDEWAEAEPDAESDEEEPVDPARLREEIAEIDRLASAAKNIGTDSKTAALLTALKIGFESQSEVGAPRKALIFTESRRTQEYLNRYLEAHGYAGQTVLFNGTNSDVGSRAIYDRWVEQNRDGGRATGSRPVDIRTALIEHFRDHASIMIATEAAAEGVNLQFCSQIINYDLPWNPQRIEQRIGRCHRYGQKHDVIVINFLNERNAADQRVHELLRDKFSLFDGVFGASDEVLGTIESGVDFERRILAIYQDCRSPEAIEAAFAALQAQLDDQIKARMFETRQTLLEHFDEDVHARLKLRLEDAKVQLDLVGQRFWAVTRHRLEGQAAFDEEALTFDLPRSPATGVRPGRYHLISRERTGPTPGHDDYLYRLSHPLGEFVIEGAKSAATPSVEICFDISGHPGRIAVVEALKGRTGVLALTRLTVESFAEEDYLLFSAVTDDGQSVDHETCARLFGVGAAVGPPIEIMESDALRIGAESAQHIRATLARSLEANNQYFSEGRERLERWAEDKVLAAERALRDTKEAIKALRRDSRHAETLEAQKAVQEALLAMEKKQRKQRQEIFTVEDEIAEKRDELISALEKRMSQRQQTETLFTVRWRVV